MSPVGLDRISLARKEGWRRFAEAPVRTRPAALSRAQLADLDAGERLRYDDQRAVWHANLGPFRTPWLGEVHEELWDIVDSNRQDGGRVRGAAAIDAMPGLGKTTAVQEFAKHYHRREIALRGDIVDEGHEHLPVARIALSATTSTLGFNQALLRFYGHPGAQQGNANQAGSRALDCVLSCGTSVIIVDDVHFLNMTRRDGVDVSNHLKALANDFPVTFLFAGVGLDRRGLFTEGLGLDDAMAQTARRWTRMTLKMYDATTEEGRQNWHELLLAFERDLVLADKTPGSVAEALSDYLYARSQGHLASLASLINRGALRAARSGTEALSVELLDRVKIDEAAERQRDELLRAVETGGLSTLPRQRRGRKPSPGTATRGATSRSTATRSTPGTAAQAPTPTAAPVAVPVVAETAVAATVDPDRTAAQPAAQTAAQTAARTAARTAVPEVVGRPRPRTSAPARCAAPAGLVSRDPFHVPPGP